MNSQAILTVTCKVLGFYLLAQSLLTLVPAVAILTWTLLGIPGTTAPQIPPIMVFAKFLPPGVFLATGFYLIRHAEPFVAWASGGSGPEVDIRAGEKEFLFHLALGAVGLLIICNSLGDAAQTLLRIHARPGLYFIFVALTASAPFLLGLLLVVRAKRRITVLLAAEAEPTAPTDSE